MDIEIQKRAKQAISDLVTAEALKEVALVVLPNPLDDCCSMGLDVQIVATANPGDLGGQS